MSGPALDPLVRLGDPCEPLSWEWEGPLSAFLADNGETLDEGEADAIRAALARGETYAGGGGAEAEWELWAVRS